MWHKRWVLENDSEQARCVELCYVLPNTIAKSSIDETKIVIPHALQMGWSEYPLFFCAATETSRDIIYQYYENWIQKIPPHPLEQHLTAEVNKAPDKTPAESTATGIEVYVDDFITCTNNTSKTHITQLARAMLHGIHSVFPPQPSQDTLGKIQWPWRSF